MQRAYDSLRAVPAALFFSVLTACARSNGPAEVLPTPMSDVAFVSKLEAQTKRVYQSAWAGAVLFSPGAKNLRIPEHRFQVIEGEWVVPYVRPTINCSNRAEPTDGSSIWIGIDGWMATFKAHARGHNGTWHTYDSTDVLQAGTESDVPCYHGGPLKNYHTSAYFWIEWAGTKDIAVTRRHRDLPVHPGDRIDVRIEAADTGLHPWREATLWLVNETTKQDVGPRTFLSGCVDCGNPFRRPARLMGDTAEWVVESTFYSSIHASLPNTLNDFGSVRITKASVTDQDGLQYSPAQPNGAVPNVDWMTWNAVPLEQGGTLLACGYIDAHRAVTMARAPYVISTPGQQGDLEPKPQHC